MILWWGNGRGFGVVGGILTWFAVAVTVVAAAIIYVTLMALYALWLLGLAAYRALRRQ